MILLFMLVQETAAGPLFLCFQSNKKKNSDALRNLLIA